jgi:tetratricopeptide (TPR) repeat protein
MSRHPWLPLILFLGAVTAPAQDDDLERRLDEQQLRDNTARLDSMSRKGPKLDPKRIINESSSFLKEREPEMSAEEYAIYERIAGMLATRPEFALRLLETMTAGTEQPSPAFQFIMGNAYYAMGDAVKAESAYLAALKQFPSFLRAWGNLGILYYSAGRYDAAVRCFSRCVALGDREPATYGLLGYSLEQEGKPVPAEIAYLQALGGEPANADWLEGLLRVYIDGKQYARAEWLIRDLIKVRPNEPKYWLVYAEILQSLGRVPEAMAMLEVCMYANIAGPTELEALANLYSSHRLWPEALEVYRRLTQRSANVGETKLLAFAEVLAGAGQAAEAERALALVERGRISPGGRVQVRLVRADLLAARKQWPAARAEFEQVLAVEPLNGRALLGVGRTHLGEEHPERAQLAFESAFQVQESTYRAALELASLAVRFRRYPDAVNYLERALAIEKTDAVQDLLRRVRPLALAAPP